MKILVWLAMVIAVLPTAKAYAKIDLMNKKVAYVVGEINPVSSMRFQLQMARTADLPGDRLIVIDSPGGEVDAGQNMIDVVEAERHSGVKVYCVIAHQASSMAFNLLTHCDYRASKVRGFGVVHRIAASGMPDDERLTSTFLRAVADDLDKTDAPYRRANAKAMHLSLKDYDLYADKETCWRSSKLLAIGYLQEIIP